MSWRIAFLIVGMPGLLLALIARLTLREPPRGMSEAAGAAGQSGPAPSIMAVARKLFRNWSFVHMTAGATLVSFAGYGVGAFSQAYFVREFHLGLATVGLIFGVIAGVSTGIGTLLGGFVTDLGAKRDKRWYALVPAIGFCIATPFYLFGYLAPTWRLAAVILMLPGVFSYAYLGPTFGVMHNLVEPRMRATATALLFFVLNLIALGGGPLFTGILSDVFAQHIFAAQGLGHFQAICPGGVAPKHGAAAGLNAICVSASALGARYAILTTFAFGMWGAVHYFIAARYIRADLARAESEIPV